MGSPPSPDDLKKLGQLSQFMGVTDQQNFDTDHLTYRKELSTNISAVIQNILAEPSESPLERQRRVARFIYNLLAAAWHTNQPETALLMTELLDELAVLSDLDTFLEEAGTNLLSFFEETLLFPPTLDNRKDIDINILTRLMLRKRYKAQLTDPDLQNDFDIFLSLRAHYKMLLNVFYGSQGGDPSRIISVYNSSPINLGLGRFVGDRPQPVVGNVGYENVARIVSYIHSSKLQPLWVRLKDHIFPDLTLPPTAYTRLKGKELTKFHRANPTVRHQRIRALCIDWLELYYKYPGPMRIKGQAVNEHDLLAVTISSIVYAMIPSLSDVPDPYQCWATEREVQKIIEVIQQHTSSLSSGGECFQTSDTQNQHLHRLSIYSITFWDANTINTNYPPGWVVQMTFKGQSAPSVFCILGRDGNLYFERRKTLQNALYSGQKEFQSHQPIESYIVNKFKLLLLSHLQHILFPPEATPGDPRSHRGGRSITKPHLLSLGPNRKRRNYTEEELSELAHKLIFGSTSEANTDLSQSHKQALQHPLRFMQDYLDLQIQFHTAHNIPLNPREFQLDNPPYDGILLRMAALLPTVLLSALQDYQERVGGHQVTVRSGHSLLGLQRTRGELVHHHM